MPFWLGSYDHTESEWKKYNISNGKWETVANSKGNILSLRFNVEKVEYYQHHTNVVSSTNLLGKKIYYPHDYYSNVIEVKYDGESPKIKSVKLKSDTNKLFSIQENPTIESLDYDVDPSDFVENITWKSSNPELATVDEFGFVTANDEYRNGKVTISASIRDKCDSITFDVSGGLDVHQEVNAGDKSVLAIDKDLLKKVQKVEWYKFGQNQPIRTINNTINFKGSFDLIIKTTELNHAGSYYAKITYKNDSSADREKPLTIQTNALKLNVKPNPDSNVNSQINLQVESSISNKTFEKSNFNVVTNTLDNVSENDILSLSLSIYNAYSKEIPGKLITHLPPQVDIISVSVSGNKISKPYFNNGNLEISEFNLSNQKQEIYIEFKIRKLPNIDVEQNQSFTIASKFDDNSGNNYLYTDESSPITMNFVKNNFIVHSSPLNFGKINAFSEMLELLVQSSNNQKTIFSSEDQRRDKGKASLSVRLINDFSLSSKQKKADKKFEAYLRYYDKNNSKNFKTIGNNELVLDSSAEGRSFSPQVFKDQLRLFIKKNPFAAGNFQGTIRWTLSETDSL